jgi:hypothetical protein
MLKKIIQKPESRIWIVPFSTLLLLVTLFAIAELMEVFRIFTSPDEGFRDYPFGTEQDYIYRSKEVYFATTFMWLYIHIQALVVSLFCYRTGQKLVGVMTLLLPFVLAHFLSYSFGNYP